MLSTRILSGAQPARFAARSQLVIFRHPSPAALRRFATSPEAPKNILESTFLKEREAVKQHAAESCKLWLKLSLYVVPPALILASINAYNLWNEHWEHWKHMPPLEERVEHPYRNIRTKNYFWGDGDKTLFWNDEVNYHKHDDE